MMGDAPNLPLLREAVARDGHKCVVCGAPCKDHEARRRIESGVTGDRADNFVAMCGACQGFLAGRLPPPARYVAHIYDATRLRRTIRRITGWTLVAMAAASWGALALILGYLLFVATQGTGSHLFATGSIAILLILAMKVWLGATGRAGPPPQRVIVTHEPQTVRVESR